MIEVKPYWQNYLDSKWVDGGAGRIDVVDPGTGQKLAEHAVADAGDVDRAEQATRRVYLSAALSDLRHVDRGRMVRAMGRYLLDNIDEIAPVLTLEQSKPLWEARIEIEGAALYFEYYGNQAETVQGHSIPLGAKYFDVTTYAPYGLVGGVFTHDLGRATRAARQIRAGQVFVSEWYAGGVETPFGGYGKSG